MDKFGLKAALRLKTNIMKRTLVTDEDYKELQKIRQLICNSDKTDDTQIDYENMDMLRAIDRAMYNLKNGGDYFLRLPVSEQKWIDSTCEDCGWHGSSKYLLGGGQIADTGDYGDCYCPVCGSVRVEDWEPETPAQPNRYSREHIFGKLKAAIIRNLENQEIDKDAIYLMKGGKGYSINDLISDISSDKDEANLFYSIILLAIDLLHRGKESIPEPQR